MHTSEQAKTLWCPMARIAQIGAVETSSTYNRALSKLHVPIALKVDEQHLADDAEAKPFQATMLKVEVQLSAAAMCVANQCAMWRWSTNGNYEHDCAVTGTDLGQPVTPEGYCGLAGAPAAL